MTEEHLMRRRSWGWISEMLWRDWDSIGCGAPEDEYTPCVARIIRLLEAGAGVDEIAAYLGEFRESIVGSEDREADRRVAQMLYDHLYI